MKNILYLSIVILLLYLYINKKMSIHNIVLVSVCISIIIFQTFTQRKKMKTEHFSIITTDKRFILEDFEEDFSKNINTKGLMDDLVYYVSSFNKKHINFNENYVNNIINTNIGALFIQDIGNYSMDYFNQNEGIKIENMVKCPNARALLETIENFSMFFYMKLITPKQYFTSDNDHTFSIIKFYHDNILNNDGNYVLFEIKLRFKKNHLNPDVLIYFANQQIPEHYTYTQDDYYNKKIFCDDNFHLFTFVKKEGKVYFYIDDYKIIDCSDENCFNKSKYRLHNDETEIKIREDFMKLNDNTNNFIKLRLNSFGIYKHRSLEPDDISNLYQYFIDIKKYMRPEVYHVTREKQKIEKELHKYTKPCPFSNNEICNNKECYDVNDWKNIDKITKNKECFEKVVAYCSSLSNLENDNVCNYLNKDNIFKMASSIDSNLFMYNPQNTTNVNNEEILKQLQKLGLKNIYLDKSYRDNSGKYSGEMQRLINDLLATNQTVELDTISALHDPKYDTTTNTINYDNLRDNISFSNDTTFEQLYNQLLANKEVNELELDKPTITSDSNIVKSPNNIFNENKLIDLDYDDISKPNAYDHIMKKYKKDAIAKEYNSWNLFDWFKST